MPDAAAGATQVLARVVEALPNALYRVEVDPTRERLTAHLGGSAGLLRLLPGEEVVVEVAPYDATRGRIVGRAAQGIRGSL